MPIILVVAPVINGERRLGTFDNLNAGWVTQEFNNLAATGTSTRLEFREVGTSDCYGMFLDDVTIGFHMMP